MSIRSHVADRSAFHPAVLSEMSKAFVAACAALNVSESDAKERETIATRIIDLARGGLTNAAALQDRVIREARVVV